MSHTCMNHNGDPAYCDACHYEHEWRQAREEQMQRDLERAQEEAFTTPATTPKETKE